jgi:hypothetical protein
MEANRGDGNIRPEQKLKKPETREHDYGLTTGKKVRIASFVGSEWSQWQASTPKQEEPPPPNYLAKLGEYPTCRKALITAITSRWVALYRHWYESLLVGSLFR